MKSVVRIFKGLSLLYKVSAYILVVLSALLLISLIIISSVSLYDGGEAFRKVMTGPDGSDEFMEFAMGPPLILVIAAYLFMHSFIFKNLAQFVDLRETRGAIADQISTLKPLVKTLFVVFILGTFFQLYEIFDTTPALTETESWYKALELTSVFLPDFGSPIGLLIALIISFFVKSLEDQEKIAGESNRLKQEAELVI